MSGGKSLMVFFPKISHTTKFWIGRVARFSVVQSAAQVFSLLGGFIIVRTLDKTEYAYFSIALSMQGMMAVLSDGGVGVSLLSIGGRVYRHKHRFGQLINTAFEVRHLLAIASVFIVSPVLFTMLTANGSGRWYSFGMVCAVLAGGYFQLTNAIFGVVPRLHLQLNRIQLLDFCFAFLKFFFLMGLCFLFLNSLTALVLLAVLYGMQTLLLKRWVSDSIDVKAPVSDEDRKDIKRTVWSIMPNSIFYCFQGQITVLLIAVFGKTSQIADVGALGKLAALFVILWSVINNIVLPHFSKCQDYGKLVSMFWKIVCVFAVIQGAALASAFVFPSQLLWVLGPKYGYLHRELVLIMLAMAANSFAVLLWGINCARGWVKSLWLNIPFTLAAQVFLFFIFDISTTSGVILFGLFSALPFFVINALNSYHGFRMLNAERTANV